MKIKAFLDTNILVDILVEGRQSAPASSLIFSAIWDDKMEAVLTTQSILDAGYIQGAGKRASKENLFKFVDKARSYINIDQIFITDLLWAIHYHSGDFEDDALVSRALETYCDVFITGNKNLRNKYKGKYEHLLFMSPEEFVAIMKGEVPPPVPAQI